MDFLVANRKMCRHSSKCHAVTIISENRTEYWTIPYYADIRIYMCLAHRRTQVLHFVLDIMIHFFISWSDLGGSDWIRKPRTKFSPDQLQALEMEYQLDPFLSTSADKRSDLAKKLKITEKNVQIWFQVSE